MEPIPVAPQGLTLGVGKLEQVEQMACEATESRRLLESELQGVEDEARRQKREEQAKREQVVEDAVQEMRFVCDVCGNKSYKNVTDYTNHLDSYDHHHAKRMLEYAPTTFHQRIFVTLWLGTSSSPRGLTPTAHWSGRSAASGKQKRLIGK